MADRAEQDKVMIGELLWLLIVSESTTFLHLNFFSDKKEKAFQGLPSLTP
jgi:hypothetical protein